MPTGHHSACSHGCALRPGRPYLFLYLFIYLFGCAGVDIIEAGFPIASPDDFEAVRAIAQEIGNTVHEDGYVPVICGLSRTKEQDLERAWDAVSAVWKEDG